MDEHNRLAERFEEHRTHLQAVAYRMLGTMSEAEDAVQDSWLRLSRSRADEVGNLGGWLTTVVARVCLNRLRSRYSRPEQPVGLQLPDPVIDRELSAEPEREALLADSVGLALVIVLEALTPAERLAFVLHDLFDLPFDEIAPMLGRSVVATRQLASRARKKVQEQRMPGPAADPGAQRRVVDAFFSAARGGDLEALVAVLDPDIVLRADGGTARPETTAVVRGPQAVAQRAILFAQPTAVVLPARVNGGTGVVVTIAGQPVSVMAFTVIENRVVQIDAVVDPDRLRELDLSVLG
jgi:RNA polymerase sigma factor (sigma-70 family)